MITYSDFREYMDYLKNEPPFEWLHAFDEYVSEKYGVRLMPTFYDETLSGRSYLHRFFIVPYSDEDYKRLRKFMEDEDPRNYVEVYRREFRKILDVFVSRYGSPVLKENGFVLPVLENSYLWHYKFNYLLNHKMWEMREKLEKYLDFLKPVSTGIGELSYCILETREQAARFYRSPEYEKVRKTFYDEIKIYDEYDVLKPEDIHILADYREHYENTPMYYRWHMDLSFSECVEYMDSL